MSFCDGFVHVRSLGSSASYVSVGVAFTSTARSGRPCCVASPVLFIPPPADGHCVDFPSAAVHRAAENIHPQTSFREGARFYFLGLYVGVELLGQAVTLWLTCGGTCPINSFTDAQPCPSFQVVSTATFTLNRKSPRHLRRLEPRPPNSHRKPSGSGKNTKLSTKQQGWL